jgi:hypothetical protein
MQPASAAQTCKTVCDQSEMHNGKLRCFSAHQECAKKESAVLRFTERVCCARQIATRFQRTTSDMLGN